MLINFNISNFLTFIAFLNQKKLFYTNYVLHSTFIHYSLHPEGVAKKILINFLLTNFYHKLKYYLELL